MQDPIFLADRMKPLGESGPGHNPPRRSRVVQLPQEQHFIIGDGARGHKAMAIHVVFRVLSLRSSVVHPHLQRQGSGPFSFSNLLPHIGQLRWKTKIGSRILGHHAHPP